MVRLRVREPPTVAAVVASLCACGSQATDAGEVVPWQDIIFVREDASGSVLMTVAPDGSGLGVIHYGGAPQAPRVSADGRRLYYFDDGPWLLVEGASAPERLDLLALAWSPTGARLAARLDGDESAADDVWVHDFDTGVRVQVSHGSRVRSVAWARDGNRLAYVDATPELWVVDLAHGEPQMVAGANEGEIFVSWSPDGGRIVYAIGPAIYVYDLADESSSLLAEVSQFDGSAPVEWSPDGRWIAWRGGVPHANAGIIRPDGSELRWSEPYLSEGPSWSPTSRFVSYLVPKSGSDCVSFDCTAMLLLDVTTDETTSLREVRAQSWSPIDDVAVVSRVRVSYEESATGVDAPSRLEVVNAAGLVVTPLGDLVDDDPRSDISPIWRATSTE
jgi:WD40 repeat protein